MVTMDGSASNPIRDTGWRRRPTRENKRVPITRTARSQEAPIQVVSRTYVAARSRPAPVIPSRESPRRGIPADPVRNGKARLSSCPREVSEIPLQLGRTDTAGCYFELSNRLIFL